MDDRGGGNYYFQALLGEYFRDPDPATAEDILINADDEMDMVMVDNTLGDMYGEQLGWSGVRALQKLRARLRTLRSYVNERDVNTIIETIVRHALSDEQLRAFWQSPTRDERLGYLLDAQSGPRDDERIDDDEPAEGATLDDEVDEIKATLHMAFPDLEPQQIDEP